MASNYQGKDLVVGLNIGAQKVDIKVKSIKVTPNVTKIADGVCGEDRDQLDQVTNFFDVTMDLFQSDAKILLAAVDEQKNQDAHSEKTFKVINLKMKFRDATRGAFLLRGISWDDWDYSSSDRAGTVMMTLNFRAQYFDNSRAA